jgi:hypothetical protein
MAISTNGTVIARLAGGLYNTVMSNATYLEVAAQDPSALANTLYARDFAKSTDLAVATTLITNLGLSTVAGLDNWVAAQLTAAGSAKGAKIVSMLNDFAGMTADTTYGAAATAFNTKVDAALAASQKTGAVEGKFATAGVVAVTNAVFALTSGVDGLDKFTGGAGDDTFNLTAMANSNALDSIDGGAGTDTLAITVTGDVTALQGKVAGIETVTATASTGNIGTIETAPAVAVKQVKTFTVETKSTATPPVAATYASTDLITVTLGDKSKTVTLVGTDDTDAEHATKIATAIDDLMDAAYGAATYASATGAVVSVTAATAGTALPTITVSGTKSDATAIDYKFTSDKTGSGFVANVEAASYVAASTFAVPASATTATLVADKQVNASASKTTDVTATAGTKATITTAKDVTVTSTGGATVKSAVGAVKVTEKGTAGSAVVVEGGTTVSITKTGSSSTGSAYSGDITVGAVASFGATSVSTDGFPEIDANVAKQPKGDVTINNGTSWTSTTGQANKTFGTGAATVYANGATTVSVATAGAITIQDVQVATRKATIDATAAKGTQTLSSVTIEGSNAAASVTSDVLTSAKVINTGASAAVTVTNATAAGHALALTLGNNTAGTVVTDDTATSVTITTEAQSISTTANASAANVDLNAAKATSLTFNNSNAVTLTTTTVAGTTTLNGATKVTSITLTGSATAALGAIADATKLTKIDGSAATGAVTVTLPATTTTGGMAFSSGSGKDVVTVAGALASSVTTAGATITTTIALGEGNDTVKFSSGSIGAGASVDGGAGTDTIAAALLNAGNSAVITNFEVLGLDLGAVTYDTNLLVGATGLELLAPLGTYTNVEQAQSLTVNANVGATATTLTFTAADVVGTADNYSITFGAKGATASTLIAPTSIDAGTLVIEGIENVTIASNQASGYVNNTIDLTSANLKTVTITGAATQTSLGFVGTNGTNSGTAGVGGAVSLIDGSAATGAISVNTTNVVANSSSTGLTIKTGAGADTITLVGQKATVEAGDGADVITVAATFGGKLTGGAGADSFNVEAAVATGVTEATSVLTTITDLAAKDKVKLLAAATSFTSTKVAVTATTLEGAIGQAAATANVATWFQYGGDTYIVSNNGDTVLSTGDLVIKVTGLVTLTNSTLDTTTDYLTIV